MWVERIVIGGFRSLSGSFEFGPGLNVCIGPNEAGKSSLHDALIRAMHGFSKTERRKSRGDSILSRSAPWSNGDRFGLNARLRTEAGFFDVEWDYSQHRVRVTDERGHDRTGEIAGHADDLDLGGFLLGIDADDFRQVCCIDQDALLAVRQSPSLSVALQEAVANIGGDVPVEAALERLNDLLRSIGARTDTLNPTPSGRINALERERSTLREQIRQAEETRRQLVGVAAEVARRQEDHNARLVERETLRQRQLLTEVVTLAERLEKARALAERAGQLSEDGTMLEESAREAVAIARDQLASADRVLGDAKQNAESAAPKVADLEAQERTLVGEVDGLAAYEGVDDSREARVRELHAAWTAPTHGPAAAPEIPGRDPQLAAYRAKRAELLALERPAKYPRLRRAAWIALVILTLGIALGVRKLVRHYRPPAPDMLSTRLAEFGGESLAELDEKCVAEDAAIMASETLVAQHREREQTAVEEREALAESLERELAGVAAGGGPIDERVSAYLRACNGRRRLVEKRMELERTRRELGEQRAPKNELDRARRDQQQAVTRLRDAYASAGIADESLDVCATRFEELVAQSETTRRAVQDSDTARKTLSSLLGDQTIEDLDAAHATAVGRHEEHVHNFGELAHEAGDAQAIADKLATIENTLRTETGRLAELEAQVQNFEEALGQEAAWKERLSDADEEHARLTEVRDAVGLARSILREAAEELSREFAQPLNEALCRNLARITGGRYHEAKVGDDLSIKVVIPGSGRTVSADDLSRATRDQIFLLERLEIASLLMPTKGAAPLLLDDPFAHYDENRLRFGLEILGDAAKERQVIVFSEDPTLGEIVAEVAPEVYVIELSLPASAVEAPA